MQKWYSPQNIYTFIILKIYQIFQSLAGIIVVLLGVSLWVCVVLIIRTLVLDTHQWYKINKRFQIENDKFWVLSQPEYPSLTGSRFTVSLNLTQFMCVVPGVKQKRTIRMIQIKGTIPKRSLLSSALPHLLDRQKRHKNRQKQEEKEVEEDGSIPYLPCRCSSKMRN